ncbi:MAG: hypothetical protein Q9217_002412 [Psora testacea]
MRTRRKVLILLCFAARISVIAATIAQLYKLRHHVLGSTDLTFDLWQVVLCTEIVQALSIITACIPYLKPFLEALDTGMIRVDAMPRSKIYGLSSYTLTSHSENKKNPSSGNRSQFPPKPTKIQPLKTLPAETVYAYGANVEGQSAVVSSDGPQTDPDAESQSSQSRIIKKTIGWTVSDERPQPAGVGTVH